jgi:hypothetical protein
MVLGPYLALAVVAARMWWDAALPFVAAPFQLAAVLRIAAVRRAVAVELPIGSAVGLATAAETHPAVAANQIGERPRAVAASIVDALLPAVLRDALVESWSVLAAILVGGARIHSGPPAVAASSARRVRWPPGVAGCTLGWLAVVAERLQEALALEAGRTRHLAVAPSVTVQIQACSALERGHTHHLVVGP